MQMRGTISFIFLDIGSSTNSMAQLKPGDEIYSLTGPLGKSFEIEEYGSVCLVGGCYGIGGIYPAASGTQRKGQQGHLLFRSPE